MMKKLFIAAMVFGVSFLTHASDEGVAESAPVLYSPSELGGQVGPNGVWEVTDPCLASKHIQE